ncbi:MAG: phenylalanine--tRNA ligase subunit alpha [Clostridia bacterium]|nr:phenylalanine--tRNA ligase subunit alpha [Clostridia bacterium]
MSEKIQEILAYAKSRLEESNEAGDVNDMRVRLLGKSGELTSLLRSLKDIPPEERPTIGKLVNEARDSITSMIELRLAFLKRLELERKTRDERIDVTLGGKGVARGSYHPCTLVREEILRVFISLGFSVEQGPEIESDYYNFQRMNMPKDHPARDMQDTFYITPDVLLRTHTSPVQARVMDKSKPPIRVVCPGKVYRPDDDATHSPMFQQVEGLVVDKDITLCDLKGTLECVAKELFDSKTKIRFRPSYFPFTEPSVEVDVTCPVCHGKGCRICKGTGWIEVLGAGVVNPEVLRASGIDPDVYSGFAFGMGVERIAMIKYGIPDMRILFENDVRFLSGFKEEI